MMLMMGVGIWFVLLELMWIGPDRGKLVPASARMMMGFSHIGGVLSSRLVVSMVMVRVLIGYSRRPAADMVWTARVVRMRSVDSMTVRIGMAL